MKILKRSIIFKKDGVITNGTIEIGPIVKTNKFDIKKWKCFVKITKILDEDGFGVYGDDKLHAIMTAVLFAHTLIRETNRNARAGKIKAQIYWRHPGDNCALKSRGM